MSGIMGIYNLDGRPVERNALQRMLDVLEHRGTDHVGLWADGAVGLAHRMRWVTPESLLEDLPSSNPRGDLKITADARIDNRDELISALQLLSWEREKITDSQIILAAYEKWGDRCPSYLMGDFAFAIWDQTQRQLFCARDPMGVKPFYYYCTGQTFVFASEIKALWCVAEVPRRLNEMQVAYYLSYCFEDKQSTFYQDIYRLPPAYSLRFNPVRKLTLHQYWELNPRSEIRFKSDRDYTEAFLELFTESVRCRLRSAYPVGSALSGGLDSSSIACTAQQLLAQSGRPPLHTFSAIFPDLPESDLQWIDERPYMNSVKELGGFQSHDIHADQLSPLIDLMWQGDEAILATNLYIHWDMYRAAQNQGVRVFLDGVDGDVTVGHGWAYLTELTYQGRWRTLARELKAAARLNRRSRKQLLWQYSISPLLIEPLRYLAQRLFNPSQLIEAEVETRLINPSLAQRVGLRPTLSQLLLPRAGYHLTVRSGQWLGLTSGLYAHIMEMADKATNQCSLEARYPFFDRRLIEFCLALPASQKFRQGHTRAILKTAMTGILPERVRSRIHKGDLLPNFRRQLLARERGQLERLMQQPGAVEQFVNWSELSGAYQRYAADPINHAHDGIAALSVLILSLWLEQTQLV